MTRVDWVVVGAGLTGATFAERLAGQGRRVAVVDQRGHVAGNAWDEPNEHGILEHKYGPHIFHTNSAEVWNYLSAFTDWRPYEHRVVAAVEGKLIPLPFNFNSIDLLFAPAEAARLREKLRERFGDNARVPVLELRADPAPELRALGDYVYEKVFRHYTYKQWGLTPEELSPSVTARVPVVVSRDDRYFQDAYQAIPAAGYGAMVSRMLQHPNIRLALGARWQDVAAEFVFDRMLYTGAIDEYFGFQHGALPYRSLRFDVKTHPFARFQPAPVVNYPNEFDYTRITEQKWITGQEHPQTTTITEYPMAHVPGRTIAYYPIPTDDNRRRYRRYDEEARALHPRVMFAGRLGDYQYYNMDQAVARALKLARDVARA